MASAQAKPNRLLRELLREEQEPFTLEAYLSERGYVKSRLKSEASEVLDKSGGCNLQRSQKGLKSLCKKLLLIGKSLSIKNCDDKGGEKEVGRPVMVSCSVSSTAVCNSCSKSEDKAYIPLPSDDSKSFNLREDEVPTDRKLRGRRKKDSKNHRSVTELKKRTHQRSPLTDEVVAKSQEESRSIPITLKNKKVTEDSILSASLLDLLVSPTTEKPGCFQVAGLRDLVLAKRILQQNKKLMFDCVREIIESHGRKEARFGEILGPEEIGKLICQKAKEWGKRSGNEHETNMNKLLNLDFHESTEQWNGLKKQKRELAMAIGDDILEELEKELVIDMVDSSLSLSRLHHI